MYICTPPQKYIKPPNKNGGSVLFLLLKKYTCVYIYFFFLAHGTHERILPTPTYSYRVLGGTWGCLAGAWRIHRVQGFSASYP